LAGARQTGIQVCGLCLLFDNVHLPCLATRFVMAFSEVVSDVVVERESVVQDGPQAVVLTLAQFLSFVLLEVLGEFF